MAEFVCTDCETEVSPDNEDMRIVCVHCPIEDAFRCVICGDLYYDVVLSPSVHHGGQVCEMCRWECETLRCGEPDGGGGKHKRVKTPDDV